MYLEKGEQARKKSCVSQHVSSGCMLLKEQRKGFGLLSLKFICSVGAG